ncbi:MAG: hypothetical protein V3R31_02520, partial [Candidatus Humimicrobiaceae bacterium]
MKEKKITDYQRELKGKTPQEIISWVIDHFDKKDIAFSSSMGAEDQVLTDMLIKIDPEIIFSLWILAGFLKKSIQRSRKLENIIINISRS